MAWLFTVAVAMAVIFMRERWLPVTAENHPDRSGRASNQRS